MAISPLTLALLILTASADAGQWTIHSDRGHEDVARRVATLLPQAQAELEATLGLTLGGSGVVVLCGSAERFGRETPGVDHRHTLGVAYPHRRTIYLNCEAIRASPSRSFAITLRHEVCHVLVGEVTRRGGRRVPLWFDEGVAVWAAGKVPRYNPQDFELAVRARSLPPLAELAEAFPRNPAQRGVAYEQSESFVRFVVDRHGEDAIRRILALAADGRPFDDAVREATGSGLADLEREWLEALTPRWPWVGWGLNVLLNPYSAFGLFGVITVLALLSFAVYVRRRRRKYKEWEQEEQGSLTNGTSPWDSPPRA